MAVSSRAQQSQELALLLAPAVAAVANYCDHSEHNEVASLQWVLDAGVLLRDAACQQAVAWGESPVMLYADHLAAEASSFLGRLHTYDSRGAALAARTWRELQVVQVEHDRCYHPEGLSQGPRYQLPSYTVRLSRAVGAFAEPAEESELVHRWLPVVLAFGIKLWIAVNEPLAETPLPELDASEQAAPYAEPALSVSQAAQSS